MTKTDDLPNRHVLIVGASGYGKTTVEVKKLVQEADRGDTAIVCIDPHYDSLASSLLLHLLERGHRDRIIYDRLCDLRRVLSWDLLSPSKARNPREREGENQTRSEQFASILLRRRGKASATDTPNIEKWLLGALNLYLNQRHHRPLADLRYAFSFDHPTFHSLISGCSHEDTRRDFASLVESGKTPYEAAEKMIQAVFKSPAFQVRTEQPTGFNFERHLNNKGILIVEGDEGGALSPDAAQTLMGAIILKTLTFLAERKREFPVVTLVLDEVNNYNLIGEAGHEVKALSTLRKYGLAMHIITQLLDFPSTHITTNILTNCATKRYFYSEPRTANRLGEDLGGSYEVDGTTTRYTKDDSYDVPTTHRNPYSRQIGQLARGECYLRRDKDIDRLSITPLPPPFGYPPNVARQVLDAAIYSIQQGPTYYTPEGVEDSPLPSDEPTDDQQTNEPDPASDPDDPFAQF